MSNLAFEKLESWLKENPDKWERQDSLPELDSSHLPVQPLVAYSEFLQKFGLLVLFGEYFLDMNDIAHRIEFIRGLATSEDDPEVLEYVPFLHLSYGCCLLCFQGERIIDFDPLNGVTHVADSFEEFLLRYIEGDGEQFWLKG